MDNEIITYIGFFVVHVALGVGFLSVLILLAASICTSVIKLKIATNGIKITIANFVVLKLIPYEDLIEIRKIKMRDIFSDPEIQISLKFVFQFWGSGILIHRKTGFFKFISYPLSDPDEFIQAVLRRINRIG